MSAGAGSRAFRDWELKRRLRQVMGLALGPAPFAVMVVILVALGSAIHRVGRFGGIFYEPAFTGQTAQHPGVGYFNLHTLEQQLAARIDQQQAIRGVWVTNGACELTGRQSASCGFFGSDGSTTTVSAYISQDGSTYWTTASNAP